MYASDGGRPMVEPAVIVPALRRQQLVAIFGSCDQEHGYWAGAAGWRLYRARRDRAGRVRGYGPCALASPPRLVTTAYLAQYSIAFSR
jgi:hypothetical protein